MFDPVGLDVFTVGAEAEAIGHIPGPFAIRPFVAQRVSGALADGLSLPLAGRRRDGDDKSARVGEPVASD